MKSTALAKGFSGSRSDRQRTNNAMMRGAGAASVQDRGATQSLALYSNNPYFERNYFLRWQEYVTWYNTSWEARKIIDIPVDDALRVQSTLQGLDEDTKKRMDEEILRFGMQSKLKRALKQERLLGGCVILGVFREDEGADLSKPKLLSSIKRGDLLALNLLDVSRLSRTFEYNNVFSPDYDRYNDLILQGEAVDVSRMAVFDGDPLLNYSTQRLFQRYGFNPLGFGESKLDPIYDLLVRAIGTQQGAYHLVNMASVLLVECDHLKPMLGVDSEAVKKLEEIVKNISIYRGAIVDMKNAKVTQHSATFGSVPELVLTFAQLLAAASDIPATRFLGQSPGGLDSSGVSDARNYYDMVDSIRKTKVQPAERRFVDWIGINTFGYEDWLKKSEKLVIEYPPLWNLSDTEQSQVDRTLIEMLDVLYERGIITVDTYAEEVNTRQIFNVQVEPDKKFIKESLALDEPVNKNVSVVEDKL